MSAYVFGNIDSMRRTDDGSDSPTDLHYHYPPQPPAPSAMVPLEQQYYQQQYSAHLAAAPPPPNEFICNVSDDDTVERDIDLEIEARIRSLTFLSDDENTANLSLTAPQPSTPELPRTMSQRMLSSLQKNKLNQTQRTERRAGSAARLKSRATTNSNAVAAPPVRSEHSFYAAGGAQPQQYAGSSLASAAAAGVLDGHTRGSELRGMHLSTRSSSCTDRLEARISKSFLNRQDSIESGADASEFSIMYSGRRTYPAESIKKNDQRLSEGTPAVVPPPTSMTSALERERQAMALAGLDNIGATRMVEPVATKAHPDSKRKQKPQDNGVSFHFFGGSSRSSSSTALAAPPQKHRLALAPPEASLQYAPSQTQQSLAMVVPARSSAMLDPKFTALATQLGDIEMLIDSIENCLSTSTLPSLIPVVLGELDLLKGSTAQIRANGATLILAEVGRPPTEMIHALRRLVARAAVVQNRIEAIVDQTQHMV